MSAIRLAVLVRLPGGPGGATVSETSGCARGQKTKGLVAVARGIVVAKGPSMQQRDPKDRHPSTLQHRYPKDRTPSTLQQHPKDRDPSTAPPSCRGPPRRTRQIAASSNRPSLKSATSQGHSPGRSKQNPVPDTARRNCPCGMTTAPLACHRIPPETSVRGPRRRTPPVPSAPSSQSCPRSYQNPRREEKLIGLPQHCILLRCRTLPAIEAAEHRAWPAAFAPRARGDHGDEGSV